MASSQSSDGLSFRSKPSSTGSTTVAPGVILTPTDWFLLSRLDGQTEVHLLGQLTGMSDPDALACVRRLIAAGLATVSGGATAVAVQPSAERMGTSPGISVVPPPRVGTSPRIPAVPGRSDSSLQADARRTGPGDSSPGMGGGGAFSRADTGSRQPVMAGNLRSPSAQASDWLQSAASSATVQTIPARSGSFSVVPESSRPGVNERLTSGKPSASTGFPPQLLQRNWPIPFDKFVFDPADLDAGPELDSEQKQVLLYFHHHLRRVTYYQLFGIEPTADASSIRSAYFLLSKAFHPDRWFRRNIGPFGARVEDIFKWVNRANGVLSSPQKRKGYDNLLRQGYIGEWQLEEKGPKPPSIVTANERQASSTTATEAQKRAANVFRARAIQAESLAQWHAALDQYHRALQLDDTSELRIALIECMIRAQRPTTEVMAELERARQAAPENVHLLLLDAELARRQGATARASRLYNEVLKVDASNPSARQGLARLGESN